MREFSICTKIPLCRHIKNCSDLSVFFKSSLERSLENLNLDKVDYLLLHDCDDLFGPQASQLVALMQECKDSGKVNKIGFSAYEPSQINAALHCFKPDVIQIPFNVFDQRLLEDGTLQRLKNLGIEIHARSIFFRVSC